MPKAVLTNGMIRPIEPLPTDWREGEELRVEKSENSELPIEEIDQHFAELAKLCADADPEDDARLGQALQEARDLSKEQVRRSMGLV